MGGPSCSWDLGWSLGPRGLIRPEWAGDRHQALPMVPAQSLGGSFPRATSSPAPNVSRDSGLMIEDSPARGLRHPSGRSCPARRVQGRFVGVGAHPRMPARSLTDLRGCTSPAHDWRIAENLEGSWVQRPWKRGSLALSRALSFSVWPNVSRLALTPVPAGEASAGGAVGSPHVLRNRGQRALLSRSPVEVVVRWQLGRAEWAQDSWGSDRCAGGGEVLHEPRPPP